MKLPHLGVLLVVALLAPLGPAQDETKPKPKPDEPTGKVVIRIPNLESDKGSVIVALFRKELGFPGDPTRAFKRLKVKIEKLVKKVEKKKTYHVVELDKIPYGTCAVVVCHDENNNGKCDKNALGIPKEGYGVSNNATGFMSAPDYEDAVFKLSKEKIVLTIKIDY